MKKPKKDWSVRYMDEALDLINKAEGGEVLSLCLANLIDAKEKGQVVGCMMGRGSFSGADRLWLGMNAMRVTVESVEPSSLAEAEKLIDTIAEYSKKHFKNKFS